jgi:hypothetical protein
MIFIASKVFALIYSDFLYFRQMFSQMQTDAFQ